MNLEKQGELACKSLQEHPQFQTEEISLLGQSQGGLIARYIIEQCDLKPRVRNLVTVATPHMGIMNNQACMHMAQPEEDLGFNALKIFSCEIYQSMGSWVAYSWLF